MIAELRWPGGRVDNEDQDRAFELQKLLHSLTSQVGDANLALLMFDGARRQAYERHQAEFDERQEFKESDGRAAKRQIEERLTAAAGLDSLSFEDRWNREAEIRLEAEIEWKREKWARGELPGSLLDREAFMHARSFVYALDGFSNLLGVVARSAIPSDAVAALAGLNAALPHLKGVRDTAHHAEDRGRGLNRNGEPLPRVPIDHPLVQAPGGGVVMLDSLNGDTYMCTLNDGTLGEVPVNVSSLEAVRLAAQQTLDSFKWKGSPMHYPMDF